jgi:hypothetical protein
MNPERLNELKHNEITRKRLAKFMALYCFRNTKLEGLHAAGQINQEEMKALMIDVVDHCYNFITELGREQGAELIEDLKIRDEVPQWYDPQPTAFTLLRLPWPCFPSSQSLRGPTIRS